MYTAEQIRNKVYIPDTSEYNLKDIELRIMIADYAGNKSIIINTNNLSGDVDSWVKLLTRYGYNVREVEFLGTKYLEISW